VDSDRQILLNGTIKAIAATGKHNGREQIITDRGFQSVPPTRSGRRPFEQYPVYKIQSPQGGSDQQTFIKHVVHAELTLNC